MAIARMILAGLQLIAFRRVAPLRFLPGFVSIGLVLLATLGMTTGFELLYGYHLLDFSLTSVVLNCGRWALLCFVIALLVAWVDRAAIAGVLAVATAVSFWTTGAVWLISLADYKWLLPLLGAQKSKMELVVFIAPWIVSLVLLLIGILRG